MARGLAYDSDEGRAYAASVTAIMTGRAYRKSADMAGRMGPFADYPKNADAMLRVIRKHRAAVANIDPAHGAGADADARPRRAWDEALALGETNGYRNAQAVVIAPTGTISFMMDCDTTGIEPDFSLVKSKRLVGGGTSRSSTRPCRRHCRSSGTHRSRSIRSSPTSTSTTRSWAHPASRASTCRCSTSPSVIARSTTTATSR